MTLSLIPPRAASRSSVPDAITEDVLAAAQRGSGDAFGALWRELAPAVSGYLASRGARDAESLTSDVFLAVLPRLGELTGGVAGLRAFVFSVAHARVVDDHRRRARRPDPIEFDATAHDTVTPSAEQEALERIGTERVDALLRRLPADYREVLALRVVADLDLEQTAAVMDRSVGSVKQLQRRALIALRAQLDRPGVTSRPADAMTDMA
jgi:RNA polymerase sigma-70 factor (ECF subfamily)